MNLESKRVSPSSMNLIFQCPRKYYYDQQFKNGEIPAIQIDMLEAMLGSNFHNVIIPNYFEMIPETPTPEEIASTAKEAYEMGLDRSLHMFKKRSESCLSNFIDFEKWRLRTQKIYKPQLIERKMFNDKYVGIVDMYNDGMVVDWKTHEVEVTPNVLRQGSVYRELIKSEGKEVTKILFVDLVSGRRIEMPNTTTGWIDNERSKMLGIIDKGNYYKNIGIHCGWCPFALKCLIGEERSLWD